MEENKDFGLPENVEEQTNNNNAPKKSHKGRNFLITLMIILMLALVAVLCYNFVPKFSKFVDENRAKIENKFRKNKNITETKDIEVVEEEIPVVEEVVVPESIVAASQNGIFLVVAGSFANPNNAEKYKKSVQDLGFKDSFIFEGKKLNHVVISSFSNRSDAIRESKKIAAEKNIETWVFEKE